MIWLDHVLLAVRDFEAAAARLRNERGLVALPARDNASGTRNWIVPLEPPQYLELIGVGDEATMRSNSIGRWLLREIQAGDHLVAWAVAPMTSMRWLSAPESRRSRAARSSEVCAAPAGAR